MHLVHSDDEPPNLSGPLEASAVYMPTLLHALMATHFAFEGWVVPVESSPQLRKVYSPAAVLAVRYASTPCRAVAENAAKAYAELRLDNLIGNIALQPERRREFIHDFVRDVLRVWIHGLTVGTPTAADEEGAL